MTIGAVLLAYAVGVGTLSSKMLGRARWTSRAPMLAIFTYLTAAWSVLAALGLAGLTLAVHTTALGGGLSHLIGACVIRLRDMYATPGGAAAAGLGLTLTGAVLARTAFTTVTHVRAVRQQTRQHAQTARMVGRPSRPWGPRWWTIPSPPPTAWPARSRRWSSPPARCKRWIPPSWRRSWRTSGRTWQATTTSW